MNNKEGLTLIEVILSLAIIGIISVTMLTIFNISLNNIVTAGVRTEAVNGAEVDLIYGSELIRVSEEIEVQLSTSKVIVITNVIEGKVNKNSGTSNQVEVGVVELVPTGVKE